VTGTDTFQLLHHNNSTEAINLPPGSKNTSRAHTPWDWH